MMCMANDLLMPRFSDSKGGGPGGQRRGLLWRMVRVNEFCDDFAKADAQIRRPWENAMPSKLNVALRWAAAIVVVSLAVPAGAAEKLRVGKAVAFAWTFTPLDVGIQT